MRPNVWSRATEKVSKASSWGLGRRALIISQQKVDLLKKFTIREGLVGQDNVEKWARDMESGRLSQISIRLSGFKTNEAITGQFEREYLKGEEVARM